MKYNYQLAKLREELASIRRTDVTCTLHVHELDDWMGDYQSSCSGDEFASHVFLPREAETVDEWLRSLGDGRH